MAKSLMLMPFLMAVMCGEKSRCLLMLMPSSLKSFTTSTWLFWIEMAGGAVRSRRVTNIALVLLQFIVILFSVVQSLTCLKLRSILALAPLVDASEQ